MSITAAQLDENNVVVNFVLVGGFSPGFVDPTGAVMGSTWTGTSFTPPPGPPVTVEGAEAEIQQILDAFAQSWGYNDMVTACSYVGDPNAQYAAEGAALLAWRSATWVWAEALQNAILGGTTPCPANTAAILALMPSPPTRPTT